MPWSTFKSLGCKQREAARRGTKHTHLCRHAIQQQPLICLAVLVMLRRAAAQSKFVELSSSMVDALQQFHTTAVCSFTAHHQPHRAQLCLGAHSSSTSTPQSAFHRVDVHQALKTAAQMFPNRSEDSVRRIVVRAPPIPARGAPAPTTDHSLRQQRVATTD